MRMVIACGGSGGHVMPGLSLASFLREKQEKISIFFVVSQKALDRKMLREEKNVLTLPMVGMPYPFSWRIFPFPLQMLASFFISLFRLIRIQPDLVVGFGGYVSVPVVLAGLVLRKPIFIHEENVSPGRANLYLSRLARRGGSPFRVGVAFEETKKFFRLGIPVVFVGNPCRRDFAHLSSKEAREFFKLKEDHFTIFLTGGSQGSHALNLALTSAFEGMQKDERGAFQVIHVAGERDSGWMKTRYETLGILARVYSFLEAMGEAYSAADLVIARGGAMTLTEIGHFRKPALLIPLRLARGHQLENVKYLSSHGGCIFLDEEKAVSGLSQEILALKKDVFRRETLSEKLGSFYANGSVERLAQEIISLRG